MSLASHFKVVNFSNYGKVCRYKQKALQSSLLSEHLEGTSKQYFLSEVFIISTG